MMSKPLGLQLNFQIDSNNDQNTRMHIKAKNQFASPIHLHSLTSRNKKITNYQTSTQINSPSYFKNIPNSKGFQQVLSNRPQTYSKIDLKQRAFNAADSQHNINRFHQTEVSEPSSKTALQYYSSLHSTEFPSRQFKINTDIKFQKFKVNINNQVFTSQKNQKNLKPSTSNQHFKINSLIIANRRRSTQPQKIDSQKTSIHHPELQSGLPSNFKDNAPNSKTQSPKHKDHKSAIKQKFYKNIYENVKQISGQQYEIDQQNIRNQSLVVALANVFVKERGQQVSSSNKRKNMNTIDTENLRLLSENGTSQRESLSSQLNTSRKSFMNHKQIDVKLLHILITRWKAVVQPHNKVKTKAIQKNISLTLGTIQKLERKKHIAALLLIWLQKMNRCKVTLKMLQRENFNVFPKTAFSLDGSYIIFKLVRHNNFDRLEKLLSHNRKLIWEHNYFGQNCLHIAAKHNLHDMIKYLVQNGADYQQKDDMNRSPLFYAVHNKHKESFLELISLGAEPWGVQSEVEYFTEFLQNLKKVHIVLLFTPISLKQYVWEQELNRLTI